MTWSLWNTFQDSDMFLKELVDPHPDIWQMLIPDFTTIKRYRYSFIRYGLDVHFPVNRQSNA